MTPRIPAPGFAGEQFACMEQILYVRIEWFSHITNARSRYLRAAVVEKWGESIATLAQRDMEDHEEYI